MLKITVVFQVTYSDSHDLMVAAPVASLLYTEHRRVACMALLPLRESLVSYFHEQKAFSDWTRWKKGADKVPIFTLSNQRMPSIHKNKTQGFLLMGAVPSKRPSYVQCTEVILWMAMVQREWSLHLLDREEAAGAAYRSSQRSLYLMRNTAVFFSIPRGPPDIRYTVSTYIEPSWTNVDLQDR